MGALDIIKQIYQTIAKVADAGVRMELQQRILELQTTTAALQDDIFTLKEENNRLKAQLDDAHAVEEFKSVVELRGGAYFKKGDPHGVAYCGPCLHDKRKVIPLVKDIKNAHCSVCKAAYTNLF